MTERSEKRPAPGDVKAITKALAAPFDLTEVKFKPQAVKNNRAMALAYVDARVIQDRLDDVLGVEGWQDEYTTLEDGSVVCRLRLRLGDDWITKMDVGSPSEQPDGGDRLKAAFSDALKRAAVKFGIGRYLYRLPATWCEYDAQKKQFMRLPTLPAFALPPESGKPARSNRSLKAVAEQRTEAPAKGAKHAPPADGSELLQRLRDYDAKLAGQGKCAKGALLHYITQEGVKAGYGADLTSWAGPAIQFAVDQTKAFDSTLRHAKPEQKAVA
ncbi:MAG: Rad52/Rad22 family DNA repair protein [Gemmataceae bacterium]